MFLYFPRTYFDRYLWYAGTEGFVQSLDSQVSGSCTTELEWGHFVGQVINFSGEKNIAKCSVDLTVLNPYFQAFFEAEDYIAFSAINCQTSKNQWAFQPYNHVSITDFNPGNTPVYNLFQEESYTSATAAEDAPYLSYSLLFGQIGIYNLYIYGYVEDGAAFWGFNGDTLDLRTLEVGSLAYPDMPYWTLVGSVYINELGLRTLEIYLGDKDKLCLLDQICLVYESVTMIGDLPETFVSHRDPLSTLSVGPFTSALRFRNLHSGSPYSLDEEGPGDINVTSWLSSLEIPDCGEYNFFPADTSFIKGVDFTNGLCLEYWQVDGNINNYAAWNYKIVGAGQEQTYISTDYGYTLIL